MSNFLQDLHRCSRFFFQFIIMLFPNFMSSRVLVRKTLAAIGGEVGNIFAIEIEAFLEEDARGASDDDQSTSAKSLKQREKRTRKIEERLFAVAVCHARIDHSRNANSTFYRKDCILSSRLFRLLDSSHRFRELPVFFGPRFYLIFVIVAHGLTTSISNYLRLSESFPFIL